MLTPELQIYLRPRVTLTFDLLTPKLTVSCPCLVDNLRQLASKSVHSLTKYYVRRQAKEWTRAAREQNASNEQSGLAEQEASTLYNPAQCFKHLCIFAPKGAIEIRYYYYYY